MCQFSRSGYTCQVNIRFKVPIRVHYVGSSVLYSRGVCLEFYGVTGYHDTSSNRAYCHSEV